MLIRRPVCTFSTLIVSLESLDDQKYFVLIVWVLTGLKATSAEALRLVSTPTIKTLKTLAGKRQNITITWYN